MAFLHSDKAFIGIFFGYLDYANILLANLTIKLSEPNDLNDNAIMLVQNKNLFIGGFIA